MLSLIAVLVVFGMSGWMIVSSVSNKKKISKVEFILTTGAGVTAGSLALLSYFIGG